MKLKGCLISDMEKIQDEYYLLFCENVRKANKTSKEKEYVKYKNLAQAYGNCHNKMKQVLHFINNL